MTTLVTLNQAGDDLYGVFDKVCVVGGGRMYYHGSAATARNYFMRLGYQPLPRQTTFDFLVSGTSSAHFTHHRALMWYI